MPRRRSSRAFLTRRDVELLLALHQYRALSVGQVERLFFPSAQTAARRARLLANRGYVSVFRVPGIADRLTMLADAGVAVVAAELGVEAGDLGAKRRTQPKDYLFAKHALAVNDVRIALAQSCAAREDVTLLGFFSDSVCRRTLTGGVERYLRDVAADIVRPESAIAHVPDGVFAIARQSRAALFFVEVDRGTESVTNPDRGFIRTLRFYLAYLAGNGYQRYAEDFRVKEPFKAFRTLVVTSSRERLENIRAAGSSLPFEPASAKRFVWLTTQDAMDAHSILEPIWVSLDESDDHRYGIAPKREGALTTDRLIARGAATS